VNAFESGARKAIPAVLIYARSGGQVLMLHRNAADRPGDYHAGKWNGLGGKFEPDESPRQAACREFREECGLAVPEGRFIALGILQFPNFKAHKSEDWIVWVFVVDLDVNGDGACEVRSRKLLCPEGELHWIPEADVADLNLWAGDRHFIPQVIARQPFMGTIWYSGDEVLAADLTVLGAPVP
jgi:8-oxo-dGTP diphosphatase